MPALKIVSAIAVMLLATISSADAAKRHKGHKTQPPTILHVDTFQVYAYDASGNKAPFRVVETLSAKRHQHHARGGACDGVHRS